MNAHARLLPPLCCNSGALPFFHVVLAHVLRNGSNLPLKS